MMNHSHPHHRKLRHRGRPLAVVAAGVFFVSAFYAAEHVRAQQGGSGFGAPQSYAPQSYGAPSYAQPGAGGPAPFANPSAQYQDPPSAAPMIPAAGAPGVSAPDANAPGDGESAEGTAAPGAFSAVSRRLVAGGPLMIPLAACSLLVIALAVERLIALRRGRIIPRPFVRRFTECVQDGQLSHDEAMEICDEFDCPVAEVFHAAVKRWGRPTVEIEQAVMDAGERIADGLRRFLRLFHAISNVAPLLGLLGTVLGMIEAFESLDVATGNSSPDMLASGISEALITTAGGLCVAIPAYLAYIYFSARADRYLVEIDSLCQQVVDSISAEGLQTGGSNRTNNRRAKRAA